MKTLNISLEDEIQDFDAIRSPFSQQSARRPKIYQFESFLS